MSHHFDKSQMASASRIRGFDGVRGLAVITVVFTHLGFYSYLGSIGVLSDRVLPLVHGGTGVYAFFVLSGLLITKLLIREHQANGSISLRLFYARRALRIFPLYFLVLGITLALTLVGVTSVRWASFLFAATYTYNFIPIGAYSGLLGHTWTLAVEEHFYLVWPAIFAWGVVRKADVLLRIALIAFVFSLAFRIIIDQTPATDGFFPSRWTFVAGGFIAVGAAMALLLEHSSKSGLWRRYLKNPGALLIGAALFGHTLVVDLEQFGLGNHLRCLGICLIIAWILLNQQSIIVRGLEFGPLRYIGKISYGIYMWQGLILGTGPGGGFWPLDPWLGLLLLFVIAPLSYHLFEMPFLRVKSRFRAIAGNVDGRETTARESHGHAPLKRPRAI